MRPCPPPAEPSASPPTTATHAPVDTWCVRPEELGVYTDGNLVTASGPAFAVDFGLALLRKLAGDEVAQRVADGMLETDKAE